MDSEAIELSENLENFNTVKEAIIHSLVRENFLTEEQGIEINSNYVVVLVKGNWFGRTIGKIINKSTTEIRVVKVV